MDANRNARAKDDTYQSATQFNFREFGVLALFAAFLAFFLVIPFMIGWVRTASGLDFDTFKEIPPGITPTQLVPNTGSPPQITNLDDGVRCSFLDGTTVIVRELPGESEAVAAWQSTEGGSTSEGMGELLRRGRDGDRTYLEWVNGAYLFNFSAPSADGLDKLVEASSMIDARGDLGYGAGARPLMARLIYDYPLLFALGLDALVILFIWGIFAGGIALATKKPKPGAPRVSREGLVKQLLALNNVDSEFVIEEASPNHLVGRWKLDQPDFRTLFGKHGLGEAYQLDLYIGADGPVRALETRGTITWDVEVLPPRASYHWSFFRGIVLFELKMQKQWALDPESMQFKKVVDYTFDVRQFKAPLVELVTTSGWCWKPMLCRPLVWRG